MWGNHISYSGGLSSELRLVQELVEKRLRDWVRKNASWVMLGGDERAVLMKDPVRGRPELRVTLCPVVGHFSAQELSHIDAEIKRIVEERPEFRAKRLGHGTVGLESVCWAFYRR